MLKLNNSGLDMRVFVCRLMLTLLCLSVATGSGSAGSAAAIETHGVGPANNAVELGTDVAGLGETEASAANALDAATWADVDLGSVERDVFELALRAAAVAIERGDVTDPATLTVIDFSEPSPN